MIDLTIEELTAIIESPSAELEAEVTDIAQQLIDTMQENEKYEELLQKYMQENAELKAHPLKLICEKCNALTEVRSEYPVVSDKKEFLHED